MEIGPIPGIRSVPAIKTGRAELQPPAVFDVEGSAKPSDSERQGNGRKGAGAEENEKDDLILGDEDEPGSEGREGARKRNVDCFA
jgi:hypothetical protein